MSLGSMIRYTLNQATFKTGFFDVKDVVKAKQPAEQMWETTAELRRKYIATSVERFPARGGQLITELGEFRDRVVHFARNRTIDKNEELVPLFYTSIQLVLFYQVGLCLGRRSLQLMGYRPYEEELDNPDAGHH